MIAIQPEQLNQDSNEAPEKKYYLITKEKEEIQFWHQKLFMSWIIGILFFNLFEIIVAIVWLSLAIRKFIFYERWR